MKIVDLIVNLTKCQETLSDEIHFPQKDFMNRVQQSTKEIDSCYNNRSDINNCKSVCENMNLSRFPLILIESKEILEATLTFLRNQQRKLTSTKSDNEEESLESEKDSKVKEWEIPLLISGSTVPLRESKHEEVYESSQKSINEIIKIRIDEKSNSNIFK